MNDENIHVSSPETENQDVIPDINDSDVENNYTTEQTDNSEIADFQPESNVSTPVKKFYQKWWFWGIIVAVIVLIVVVIAVSSSSGSSDNDSYGGYATFESPYVTMVKDATNSNYGITYGRAFSNFFSSPHWEYFESTDGSDVVEFNGKCLYSGSTANIRIQFTLNLYEGTFSPTYLSINGESQSRLLLAAMINKIFESYYD